MTRSVQLVGAIAITACAVVAVVWTRSDSNTVLSVRDAELPMRSADAAQMGARVGLGPAPSAGDADAILSVGATSLRESLRADLHVERRVEAAAALGDTEFARADVVYDLEHAAWHDDNLRVRREALRALASLRTPAALTAIAALTRADDERIRADALDALAEIDVNAAANELRSAMGDASPLVRTTAETWLEELDATDRAEAP